jgi:hypothetical protein
MNRIFTFLLLLFFIASVNLKTAETSTSIEYNFILQDSPAQLFTMRQFNQTYLSGYRLMARGINAASSNRQITDMVQIGVLAFVLMPLSHEEGHRSILTGKGIGAISQPYMNKHGAAYVNGVTDETLQQLRDSDLPSYIRLHAGGLESDYMLTNRIETIAAFHQDRFNHFKWEYWIRKLSILQYYATALIKYDIDLDEEQNELNRDIVGHDVYGAARHLHRPTMDFYRYTRYKDLTRDEKEYVTRLGLRSFLNLLNPLILGKKYFQLTAATTLNAGLGFTMSPFGDFIDENIWIQHRDLKIHFYARQFQNKENWFPAFGLRLMDMRLLKSLSINLAGHFWQQPKKYDFRTTDSFNGGAVDLELQYFFVTPSGAWLEAVSVDVGIIAKSKGFLPEELALEEHFGLRIGTSLRL